VGWEDPRYAAFVARLARGRRLLVFDRRGVGMSDPAPAEATLAQQGDDIATVMDAAGARRAVVFGISVGGPTAVSLAVRRPERVAALVLYSCFGRLMVAPDYPWGWTPEFLELYKASLEQAWAEGRGVELALPTARDDPALVEWTSRYLRLATSPARARAMLDLSYGVDIRDELARVEVPTLVLHRRDEDLIDVGNGRYVADHIPGARYVEVPGADHWPWVGDTASVLDPVDAFLDGLT
jgi:pimeloyl-ACP methyl ester carboxylesterase